MKLLRKYRILTALVALWGMLFMQLAVASYACAGASDVVTADSASMQAMPGCDQPDSSSPALCHAHCQDAKSSLDRPELPVVSPAVASVCAILTPLEPLAPAGLPGAQPPSLLQRSTAPPISIRHCCLRI